jgi:hypothetical protein
MGEKRADNHSYVTDFTLMGFGVHLEFHTFLLLFFLLVYGMVVLGIIV